MPTKPNPNKPHRLNLEMSDEVAACLARLVAKSQADSRSEVIRRSMALYEQLLDARAKGSLIVIEKNGKRTSVAIL